MKRLVLIMCLLAQPVFAKTIPVQALNDFSSENPPEKFSIKVLDNIDLDAQTSLKEGDVVYGTIVDVKNSKRLKRNATFSFVPQVIHEPDGNIIEIKGYFPAKYTTKLNKGEIAKSAVLSVGNYFVKGLSMGYTAIEGAVKNEKDNRFKSTVNAVYESSPLSYVEKGHELFIPKEQNFLLNFKVKDDEDVPNYEYEELD